MANSSPAPLSPCKRSSYSSIFRPGLTTEPRWNERSE